MPSNVLSARFIAFLSELNRRRSLLFFDFFIDCMKHFLSIFLLFPMLVAFSACGEDRTPEYEQLTACDHWMTTAMKDYYLWGDSIKEDELAWKTFFYQPQTFFSNLIKFAPITDSWSWCEVDTLNEDHHERGYFNHIDSYGMDFLLMTDPTGATSRQYARVKTVIKDSPADRAGLERGDFIGMVDGNRMTSAYLSYLISGRKRTLVVSKLGVNDDQTEFYWTQEDTVYMDRSEYVEDLPFPVVSSFQLDNVNVAYLMCNRLTTGPIETEPESQSYVDEMKSTMKAIKELNSKVMVLDLRLCNFGDLSMAALLGSYVAGERAANRIFAQTFHRSDKADDDQTFYFDNTAKTDALEPELLFVITSSYTSGAAEWLIRALRNVLGEANVYVVGQTTNGQIVITEEIHSEYYVTINPAVAFVADENGDYSYASGIRPDVEINEMSYVQLYPYGDENEVILSAILGEVDSMY